MIYSIGKPRTFFFAAKIVGKGIPTARRRQKGRQHPERVLLVVRLEEQHAGDGGGEGRAHLPVDVELASAFLQAQSQDSKVSWIACTIKGEAVCLIKAHDDATSELSRHGRQLNKCRRTFEGRWRPCSCTHRKRTHTRSKEVAITKLGAGLRAARPKDARYLSSTKT